MAKKKKSSQVTGQRRGAAAKRGASAPRRGILLRVMIALSIAAGVAVSLTYAYIDRRVSSTLSARQTNSVPAIYGDGYHLGAGQSVDASTLTRLLNERNYRQVTGVPQNPGEYRASPDRVELITRSFRAPDGQVVSSLHSALAVYDGQAHEDSAHALYLEPTVITHLGGTDAGAEVKAERFVALADIPKNIQNAVIGIEDERFYSHHGIDFSGLLRAVFQNIRALRIVQGGSTLTQQLAKNLFFSPRRTLGRKVQEAMAAISIERHLTKPQILELYLNEVYLGQEGAVAIHGVAEASRSFFGKDLRELNVGEAAMLAGIIKAPSYYSPRRHLDRAIERRNVVLTKMQERNFISNKQMLDAELTKVKVKEISEYGRNAPYFITALSRDLDDHFNVEAARLSGLSIYTGLQPIAQRCAEKAVSEGLQALEAQIPALKKSHKTLQASLVSLEPFSGKIRAWVGGRDFSESQYDRASLSRRQIGSTIKPFLYLTALDGSLNSYRVATPMSILSDRPVEIDQVRQSSWEPENYDHNYRGDVTLRYALENSLNLPAVYVAQKVGIRALVATARKFHLASEIPEVPALALGAADTTLLDLTAAYGALANGGVYVAPRFFVSALDGDGSAIAANPIVEEHVASEDAVFVLTNILQGVVERGTARVIRKLGYSGTVAGKTGTSNDARDAWFVGFSPGLASGVWVGYDDNSKTGLTGGQAAAPIWTRYMQCVAPIDRPLPFIQPPGVISISVDSESGELATRECPDESVVREFFVRGTEPLTPCHLHSYGSAAVEARPPEPIRPPPRRGFWESLFGSE